MSGYRVEYRCLQCDAAVDSPKWGQLCGPCREAGFRARAAAAKAAAAERLRAEEIAAVIADAKTIAFRLREAEREQQKVTRLPNRLDLDDASITRCPDCDALTMPGGRHQCVRTVQGVA